LTANNNELSENESKLTDKGDLDADSIEALRRMNRPDDYERRLFMKEAGYVEREFEFTVVADNLELAVDTAWCPCRYPFQTVLRIAPEEYQRPQGSEFSTLYASSIVTLHTAEESGTFPTKARLSDVRFGDGILLMVDHLGVEDDTTETIHFNADKLSVLDAELVDEVQWVGDRDRGNDRPRLKLVIDHEELYRGCTEPLETDRTYGIKYKNTVFAGRIAEIQFRGKDGLILYIEREGDK
jgi:hypothetical protein